MCACCGDWRHNALHEELIDGKARCLNSIAPLNHRNGTCSFCNKSTVPVQAHHPLGRILQAALGEPFASFTEDWCLNCHGVVSTFMLPFMDWQSECRDWTPAAMVEHLLVMVVVNAVFARAPALMNLCRDAAISVMRDQGANRWARKQSSANSLAIQYQQGTLLLACCDAVRVLPLQSWR